MRGDYRVLDVVGSRYGEERRLYFNCDDGVRPSFSPDVLEGLRGYSRATICVVVCRVGGVLDGNERQQEREDWVKAETAEERRVEETKLRGERESLLVFHVYT